MPGLPRNTVIEMRNIRKRFPGVVANDGVNFELRAGEIHALLGENGAGKSTLMNILTGLYRQDEGEIIVRGRRVDIHSPKDAMDLGIGMVHQHFRLVQPFTVAENVILGLKTPRFRLSMSSIERKIEDLSAQYGLKVDPRSKIWQLSVGEQQRVEIIKMLYRGAQFLILDEPTAVLTPREASDLMSTLKKMAEGGRAIIFITHKLDEVMRVADRVTVLRGGKAVVTVDKTQTNQRELARLMVGREVGREITRGPATPGEVVLRLESVEALSDRGLPALRGVSFCVREKEILGIAGVAGNGQRELAQVVSGLRKVTSGQIFVCGRDVTNRSPREIIEAGTGHVPEDRYEMGVAPNLSVLDNSILKAYRESPISKSIFINKPESVRFARSLVDRYQVKTPRLTTPTKLLSGGNLQKLILAREINGEPRLIIAVHPTRGLDIGATESVHEILLAQRSRGTAILLISEDLDEIMALSDRIAVIYEGEIMGIVDSDGADMEEIGLMMAGSRRLGVNAV